MAFPEPARQLLWQQSMGDPRLLEGFVVWSRPTVVQGGSLTEAAVRNYLEHLEPDTPGLWPEPVRQALSETSPRMRACVALAYAWEEHWNQGNGAGVLRGELELAWHDPTEQGRMLSWLTEEHRSVLRGLTAEELALDLRVLASLDELKAEQVRRSEGMTEEVLAKVRPNDPWATLVCRYQEARR